MPEPKTKPTEISLQAFLAGVEPESRRDEGRALDTLFRRTTGWEGRLWGPTILGYGSYRYRYESGRTGESCATGFSPRKAEIVIYGLPEEGPGELLSRLGKFRTGKSCLYFKRLHDIDQNILAEIITAGLAELSRRWPVSPS